jgi:hypothetical protein
LTNLFSIPTCPRSSLILSLRMQSRLVSHAIHQKHFISAALILLISLPLVGQLLLPYSKLGSITVRYPCNLVCV